MPPRYHFISSEIIRDGRVERVQLDQLKIWCDTQNLPILSEEQLVLFLLSCCSSLEATQNTIKTYFKCKSRAPAIFHNRNFEAVDVQQAMKICEFSIIPTRTNDNNAILLWRLKDTSYSSIYHFDLESVMKVLLMVGELPLYQDPPDGIVVLIDQKGLSLFHFLKLMKLRALHTFFRYVQDGFPCKVKQIHVLNKVYFIDKIMAIFKLFMTKESYNMCLPIECLPEDYGGILPCQKILSIQTYNLFRGMKAFYKDEEEQIKSFKLTR